ncbi:hypothetical protein BU26DRAFT_512610 [Trematosphaeria pertusa]|uniref:G-patch domain-containing protein n=1 Tax=Trematosphaeria pertusa TaxID=390896 RepID=A0A6A6IYZ2_9PLEO|nr:uncharacterized protein BU26DRAFT_512610 [Trematosphaeria pertusa]KAF2255644.1 hypothetical protein BU26DRAFT_512610 [Trematosphaeria pertusa]
MPVSDEPYPEEYPEDARYDDADISTAPFVQQPAFGQRLWKNPVRFVPAAPPSPPLPAAPKPNGRSIAEKYLAIVFPNGQPQPKPEAYPTCGICGALVKEANDRAHYLSLAHQGALPRAPTPSSIDRTRMGLKYLKKHGFDVDSRVGLGASGQGMLFPIVPKEKRDKLGLGVDKKQVEREKREGTTPKDVRLDAGKVRKLHAVQKRKEEKLRKMFYGNEEVEKYLGELEGVDHGLK